MTRSTRADAIAPCLLLGAAFALFTSASHAECQSELRILADDLAGVKLTSAQSQQVADKVLQARRHCWVQHEQAGEFDWETVPLESLEKTPSNK